MLGDTFFQDRRDTQLARTRGGFPVLPFVRRRSSASRSFVLAALRALHLDPSSATTKASTQEANPVLSLRDARIVIWRGV